MMYFVFVMSLRTLWSYSMEQVTTVRKGVTEWHDLSVTMSTSHSMPRRCHPSPPSKLILHHAPTPTMSNTWRQQGACYAMPRDLMPRRCPARYTSSPTLNAREGLNHFHLNHANQMPLRHAKSMHSASEWRTKIHCRGVEVSILEMQWSHYMYSICNN